MDQQNNNSKPAGGDEERLERERGEREAEELRNFERRADWWALHFGGTSGDDARVRRPEAPEHAQQLPSKADAEDKPD